MGRESFAPSISPSLRPIDQIFYIFPCSRYGAASVSGVDYVLQRQALKVLSLRYLLTRVI